MIARTLAAVWLFAALNTEVSAADLSGWTAIPDVAVDGSSYVRLYSLEGSEATFQLRAFGPSGTEYTVPQVTVPAYASRQVPVQVSTSGGDQFVTLYAKGSRAGLDLAGVFQFIKYSSTGEFQNLSRCTVDGNYTSYYGYLNNFLMDVHTSRLAGYPSIITLTNLDQNSQKYFLTVRDAGTGQVLDIVTVSIPGNGSVRMPFADVEKMMHWTPGPDQLHVNIETTAVEPGFKPALTSHVVLNSATGGEVGMSAMCPIFPSSTTPTFNGFGGYDPCNLKDDGTVVIGELSTAGCPARDFPGDRSTLGRIGLDTSKGGSDASGADGRIEREGDVDWYGVNLVQGRTYRIAVMQSVAQGQTATFDFNLQYTVRLRDPAGLPVPGIVVTTNLFKNAFSNYYEPITEVSYTVPFNDDLPTSRRYYVEVSASPAVNGSKTGYYQVQVIGPHL